MFPRTHSTFLPVMTCRLMLSLKKAASEPTATWSLSNATVESPPGETIEFAAPTYDVAREISGALSHPDGENIELRGVSRKSESA